MTNFVVFFISDRWLLNRTEAVSAEDKDKTVAMEGGDQGSQERKADLWGSKGKR
jgi:hypothetical protein